MAKAKKTTAKKTPAKKIYSCRTCGKTTTEKKHLCNPGKLDEAYICDYCGSSSTNPAHLCKPKVDDITGILSVIPRLSSSGNNEDGVDNL
jgi:predicted RNA-binding Zn-ribbon protein involved in translation (DUF1610 family)